MGASDKRARKKEHRDAVAAARAVALRRRRTARIAGVLLALAVIVGLALFTADEDDEAETTAEPTATAEPSPDEPVEAAEAACGAEAAPPGDPQQYDKPDQVLKDGVDYAAVMDTSCGEIRMDLLEDQAPETVNNFVFLAREGFYDGVIFHRVERDFVIQGGDPNGRSGEPPDGPGYAIEDELPEKASQYVFGTLAMANSGPDTGGSQFFIVTHDPPTPEDKKSDPAGLTPSYAIFGTVEEESFAVVDEIQKLETFVADDPAQSTQPVNPVYINSIEIIER